MRILISEDIAARLKREGFRVSPSDRLVTLPRDVYNRVFDHWTSHGHDRDAAHTEAVINCLTHPDHGTLPRAEAPSRPGRRPNYFAILYRSLVLLFVIMACARAGHCQGKDSQIFTIGWTGNGVTGTKTYAGPFKISLGTNLSGSVSGSTITLSASSTASTAWSAITAATNSNVGTFAMSGNTLDLTAATLVKLRVAGGLTTSVNGDVGYDSTAGKWLIWQGGANRNLIASTNLGATGQALLSNADGSATFADPIVSGPDAPGVAPTKNPVQIGLYDGTNVQRVLGSAAGRLSVDINTIPTTTVSGTVTANQGTANSAANAWPVIPGDGTNSIGALVNYGSTPTAVKALSANVFVTNSPTVTAKLQDGSGNNITSTSSALDVNIKSSGLSNQSVNLNQIAGVAVVADPCQTVAKTYTAINFAATANQKIVALASSKKTYICQINIVVGAATNLVVITGTKTTNECDTSTAGIFGGTTAATGWNFAANGGIVIGNGASAVASGGTSLDLCMIASAANQVSGNIAWVQQ